MISVMLDHFDKYLQLSTLEDLTLMTFDLE